MKTALITTTINVPHVLSLYRAHDLDVMFFVAGDEKTPDEAYDNFLPNSFIYSPEAQKSLGYKSSDLIGWNTDSRRNIALLEALKWGAEIIVSIDDDMIPLNSGRFWIDFNYAFRFPFNGLQLGSYKRWVDVGELTVPQARQRGIPPDAIAIHEPRPIHDAKIGAAQGIILGVPDAAATHTIANHPHIHSATDILRNGFVTHPESWTVFNSQLTAFRRELAPAFAQLYSAQGRNTDIFASLMMRRLMRARKLYTYFGPPFAFHARSTRLLYNDLKAEMIGNERIGEWADYLDRATIAGDNAVDDVAILTAGFGSESLFPHDFWDAWLADCESVL